MNGVSIDFFCAVEKALRKATRAPKRFAVDRAVVNRWITLLAQVETDYRAELKAWKEARK
jgi:hypothetical protein